MAHAKFSPSSAHRWMGCNGSFALEAELPPDNGPNPYADEGTVAHHIAAECLQLGRDAVHYLGVRGVVHKGHVTLYPSGPTFEGSHAADTDFVDAVQIYLDYVRTWVQKGYQLLVEQKVDYSNAIGVEGQFGTSDAILISADGTHVVVADLKFGRGVKVYAEKNHQALSYGLGTDETFGVLGDFKSATLVIVQPRLDHIDEWECSIEEVRAHGRRMASAAIGCRDAVAQLSMMREGVKGAEEVFNKKLTPGDKQCQWCKAKATCPALRAQVSKAVFDDFQVLDDPALLSTVGEPQVPRPVEKLGAAYNLLPLIEKWLSAVRAEVERRVFAGETVIGADDLPLRLAEGRKGNKSWIDEKKAAGVLVGLLPRDKVYEPEYLKTPAAIGKFLDKKATKAQWTDMVLPLTTQAPGKVKVVLGSDPSPPYTGEAKMDEFADLDDPSL